MSAVVASGCGKGCPEDNREYPKKSYEKFINYDVDVKNGPLIFSKDYSAIVAIRSTGNFNFGSGPVVQTLTGAGFFIKGHFLVTTTSNVVFPQSFGPSRLPTPSPAGNYVVAQTVYVTVYNNNGRNVVYQADIIGVDGASGIAVLHISPTNAWNVGLPRVTCARYLQWSCTRKYISGADAYLINFQEQQFAISKGVVRNNRYLPIDENYILETVLTDISAQGEIRGAPILDNRGAVLGITLTNDTSGIYGVSQYVAERVVKVISSALFKNGVNLSAHLVAQTDTDTTFPTFYRYIKSFLGLSYDLVNAQTLLAVAGTVTFKEVVGIVVTALDGSSPLVGVIAVQDIITEANGKCLGGVAPEDIITNWTWFLLAGGNLSLVFRKFSEDYAIAYKVIITVIAFPFVDDHTFLGISMSPDFLPLKPLNLIDSMTNSLNGQGIHANFYV